MKTAPMIGDLKKERVMRTTLVDRLAEARDDPQDLGFGEISELGRDALSEIGRLKSICERASKMSLSGDVPWHQIRAVLAEAKSK